MTDHVDFLLLPPDGVAVYCKRRPGESINDTIRRHVPDCTTQGAGLLRMWFSDTFTSDMPPNLLADQVVTALCYRHPSGWRGVVALSMEEDARTGQVPPLLAAEIRAAMDAAITGVAL